MWRLAFSEQARKFLRDQDKHIASRLHAAIKKLADDPRPFGAIKLKGEPFHRIRVGGYRVLYEIRDDVLLVLVVRIGSRGGVYDGM